MHLSTFENTDHYSPGLGFFLNSLPIHLISVAQKQKGIRKTNKCFQSGESN